MNHLAVEVNHYGCFQQDNQLHSLEQNNRCIMSALGDEIQSVAELVYALWGVIEGERGYFWQFL
jgi:hypothetical protein